MENFSVLSVSDLNFYIKTILDNDENLQNIFLSGEISNLSQNSQSGIVYLCLKDEKCVVKGIIFSSIAKRIRFNLQNGIKVIVRCHVSVYEPSGNYQIYIEDIQPVGLGALSLAFEQLKEKLFLEGLFDEKNKIPLPKFPKTIGIITSKTGAVFHDIQKILARRYPLGKILLYPVSVQGQGSAQQICEAIDFFNQNDLAQVLIVARGGGSMEDLWCFNEEFLARAVASSKIPIISAVGHETDFTICDFVADMRAPTPSAAAEIVSPNFPDLLDNIEKSENLMAYLMQDRIKKEVQYLDYLSKKEKIVNPKALIDEKKLKLDFLISQMQLSFERLVALKKEWSLSIISKLEGVSPLKILSLGYALVKEENGKSKKNIKGLKKGSKIQVQLNDGILDCIVDKVERVKL